MLFCGVIRSWYFLFFQSFAMTNNSVWIDIYTVITLIIQLVSKNYMQHRKVNCSYNIINELNRCHIIDLIWKSDCSN